MSACSMRMRAAQMKSCTYKVASRHNDYESFLARRDFGATDQVVHASRAPRWLRELERSDMTHSRVVESVQPQLACNGVFCCCSLLDIYVDRQKEWPEQLDKVKSHVLLVQSGRLPHDGEARLSAARQAPAAHFRLARHAVHHDVVAAELDEAWWVVLIVTIVRTELEPCMWVGQLARVQTPNFDCNIERVRRIVGFESWSYVSTDAHEVLCFLVD